MSMLNGYGGMPPSNNSMWIGNNYSSMPRSNYPTGNQNNIAAASFMNQPPQSINNVLQVMGPESVQSYLMGPNSNAIFMDSKRDVFYTKKTDDAGYAETRAFAFHEIPLFEPAQSQPTQNVEMPNQNYVTKSDFEDFKKMIEDLVMHNE